MAKDPAFLFYSQDFFTGVSTMNFDDRGKYITILCLMHQQGRMSEESISFLVGSISVNLKSKFRIDEKGLWYNERLETETEKRNKFTESRRNNGLLGGRGKKKTKAIAKPIGIHKDNLMENVNEIENKDLNINNGVVHEIQKFVSVNCPNVSKMKTQLTFENCAELEKKYPRELIEEKLKAMENKKDLTKKYVSVYLTVNTWCRDFSGGDKSKHNFTQTKNYDSTW